MMSMQQPIGEAPVKDFMSNYLECLALVERLHRLLLDVIKDEFERLGVLEINAVQALLLFNIGDNEVTAGELKSRGYYQGSNVSYNLKKLVELGFMHHQRCEIDRRSVRVRLTERGREVRQEALLGRLARAVGHEEPEVPPGDGRGEAGGLELAQSTGEARLEARARASRTSRVSLARGATALDPPAERCGNLERQALLAVLQFDLHGIRGTRTRARRKLPQGVARCLAPGDALGAGDDAVDKLVRASPRNGRSGSPKANRS